MSTTAASVQYNHERRPVESRPDLGPLARSILAISEVV
jgi:hypothetical protein